MTIDELNTELEKLKVSTDKYYLHGLYGSSDDNNKLSLQIKAGKFEREFEVYYKEMGEKHSVNTFTKENEACEYFLSQIQEQQIIEKAQKVVGLSGMTVNERLWASGLMDEFDKAKNTNKTQAIFILRVLKVDEPSIKKIIK